MKIYSSSSYYSFRPVVRLETETGSELVENDEYDEDTYIDWITN